MDRTTEYIVALVLTQIMEHYLNMHLDLDTLFVNNIAFNLAKSRNIMFVHQVRQTSKDWNKVNRP